MDLEMDLKVLQIDIPAVTGVGLLLTLFQSFQDAFLSRHVDTYFLMEPIKTDAFVMFIITGVF